MRLTTRVFFTLVDPVSALRERGRVLGNPVPTNTLAESFMVKNAIGL
jgi:hypothetical protein